MRYEDFQVGCHYVTKNGTVVVAKTVSIRNVSSRNENRFHFRNILMESVDASFTYWVDEKGIPLTGISTDYEVSHRYSPTFNQELEVGKNYTTANGLKARCIANDAVNHNKVETVCLIMTKNVEQVFRYNQNGVPVCGNALYAIVGEWQDKLSLSFSCTIKSCEWHHNKTVEITMLLDDVVKSLILSGKRFAVRMEEL